ncbi:DUF4401 domain-containing protein [Neolewinella aurantiaca]|uniref:DUF4401 domain-containing protein n=1 Tax=Neolewinella aurantiaca TaxID=2602767 RepID=A0A5C7FTA5_9BACT|nr:DUF4401 domain-containing protein [Neolewinella aurantiaca]TXF89705.1 DUF4401 domain-containing protein [Neolewinella aurantiaca]
MTEKKLLEELDQLERELGRPLQIDQPALLHEFHDDQEHEGTLGMKVLSIVSAFIATGFFIGFTFLIGLNSTLAFAVMGTIMLGAGCVFCRRDLLGILGEAFGVALMVCGFPLFLAGMSDVTNTETGMALAALALAVLILVITENKIITFLATVTMGGCMLFLAHDDYGRFGAHLYVGFFAIALTLWVQSEALLLKSSGLLARRYDGVRTGLILALLIGAGYLSDFRFWMDLPRLPNWYASVALVPLLFWLVYDLLKRFNHSQGRVGTEMPATAKATGPVLSPLQRLYLAGLLALLIPTIFAPALSATLLCLLLAWKAGYRTGTALAVIALIYFISRYYYDMNLSLLTKSIILSTSGGLFLAAWALLRKKISSHETTAPGPGGR